MSSINEEEKKQLLNECILFKEGDKFLEAGGFNKDWPNGRGIFHNNEKTLIA